MKTAWLMTAVLSASLALAQETQNPPPRPPEGQPPPEGGRGEGRRPQLGEHPGRPPLPPAEGERRGQDFRDRFRQGMPMMEPQSFEAALRREFGPQAEEFQKLAQSMLKDGLVQAKRLFEERRFEEGRDMMRNIARQFREMQELRQRDPERFKLQQQIAEAEHRAMELGQKLRRPSDDEGKKQAATELKELLNKLFDLRQEEREKSVQQLERELKELHASLDQRKAKRDEMIQHRFDQLTGKAEMLDW